MHVVKMFIVLGHLFMRGSTEVSTGGPDHPFRMEMHKAVDYLRITGWKITKLPMSGHHRTASEAPLIRRFAGGPMVARFGYFLCPCKCTAINKVKLCAKLVIGCSD